MPEIAATGDSRVLLIDGEPVPYALARIPLPTDNRGNLAAGAKGVGREINERDRWLAAEIGPALAERGMVFVGIDVIGGFVTEINVTSPTGIRELDQQFGLNIGDMVIAAFERRIGRQELAMSARALQLREGIAPTRDRLTTTVFMAALVHGVIIVGVTFGSTARPHAGAPGLEVLIVSEDVPEARRNDDATYLAQRTQLGSGNSTDPAAARSPRAAAEHAANNGPPGRHHAGRRWRGTARHRRQPRANYHRAHAGNPLLRAACQPHRDDRGAGAGRGQQRSGQARPR